MLLKFEFLFLINFPDSYIQKTNSPAFSINSISPLFPKVKINSQIYPSQAASLKVRDFFGRGSLVLVGHNGCGCDGADLVEALIISTVLCTGPFSLFFNGLFPNPNKAVSPSI